MICSICGIEKNIIEFDKNRKQCKECRKIYKKQNYMKTKKYQSDYYKQYYIKNKENINKRHKEYNINNKEHIRLYNFDYRKKDVYLFIANAAIRNHINHGYIVNITKDQLKILFENTKICPICGIDLIPNIGNGHTWNSPSLDRINNEKEININNIQIICKRCNVHKQNKTMDEMAEWANNFLKYYNNVKV